MKNEIEFSYWPIKSQIKPKYYVSVSTNDTSPSFLQSSFDDYKSARSCLETMLSKYSSRLDWNNVNVSVIFPEKVLHEQKQEITSMIQEYISLKKVA